MRMQLRRIGVAASVLFLPACETEEVTWPENELAYGVHFEMTGADAGSYSFAGTASTPYADAGEYAAMIEGGTFNGASILHRVLATAPAGASTRNAFAFYLNPSIDNAGRYTPSDCTSFVVQVSGCFHAGVFLGRRANGSVTRTAYSVKDSVWVTLHRVTPDTLYADFGGVFLSSAGRSTIEGGTIFVTRNGSRQ